MNVAALIHSDLRNENGSGPETKDAELAGISCLSECSKSNQARTQQRRGLNVAIRVRNRNAKTLISNGEFGITAVPCVAVNCAESQRFSLPDLQYSQLPQVHANHGMPTRSPALNRWALAPAAATRPTIWWPGTSGSFGSGRSPSTA